MAALVAALAVAKKPPHHPPPLAPASSSALSSLVFSEPDGFSEVDVCAVFRFPVRDERPLSPDFRTGGLSSLVRPVEGVGRGDLVDDLGSLVDNRGVPGPLLGRWDAILPSSARISCSGFCSAAVVFFEGAPPGCCRLSDLASMPRSSN